MTIPVAYTEVTLAQFMHSELGVVAGVLKISAPSTDAGSYQEPVNEVMLELGVTDLEMAPDIRKVRALARREAWRMAVNGLAVKYDFKEGGDQYDRSQMHDQASKSLERAESDCLNLGIGLESYTVEITSTAPKYDPYSYPKDPEAL